MPSPAANPLPCQIGPPLQIIPGSCLKGSGLLLTPEFRDAVVPASGAYTLQNAEGKQTSCTITRKAQVRQRQLVGPPN